MYGYTGKILRLDLTNGKAIVMNTRDYEQWVGGHGMGSAIFWDLAVKPGDWDLQDGFDPRNVVTMMTSPCTGTLAPSMGARMTVQGVGIYPYPFQWFTRSNIGGRFAAMLKWAGWDGIVITGKASSPVWVSIVNDRVTFEDASHLWGLDTWEAQHEIWAQLCPGRDYTDWWQVGTQRSAGRTTQKPAVMAIGPAGENLSRIGTIVHDQGDGAGQGGFGGIWGSKNLKAIGVIGTGSVDIADPKALMDARTWLIKDMTHNVDDPSLSTSGDPTDQVGLAEYVEPNRTAGCMSCFAPCRRRYTSGRFNDQQCHESYWYPDANTEHAMAEEPGLKTQQVKLWAADWVQKYGVSATDINAYKNQRYLLNLYKMGVLGLGKQIDSAPLDYAQYGTAKFAEDFVKTIAYRKGIGNDLAEGLCRAAKKWGRLEEDLDSGLLPAVNWGYMWHWSLPGVEWAYGSLMGDRDINTRALTKFVTNMPVEEMVNIWAEKTVPFTGDPFMFDYGDGPTGIYSEHKAKLVAWYRRFSVFWLDSVGGCEWRYPRVINTAKPDFRGFTPDLEERVLNAVTGNNKSYAEYMQVGGKILNLDRAIHVLQGRHRDNEKFAPFIFKPKDRDEEEASGMLFPFYQDGKWGRKAMRDRFLVEDRFEEWKTHYYKVEGWDTKSGWPTRSTLEGLGLGHVADVLQARGKLGG